MSELIGTHKLVKSKEMTSARTTIEETWKSKYNLHKRWRKDLVADQNEDLRIVTFSQRESVFTGHTAKRKPSIYLVSSAYFKF
jgi:hypothetical protein